MALTVAFSTPQTDAPVPTQPCPHDRVLQFSDADHGTLGREVPEQVTGEKK
jgi:hypothetical protein